MPHVKTTKKKVSLHMRWKILGALLLGGAGAYVARRYAKEAGLRVDEETIETLTNVGKKMEASMTNFSKPIERCAEEFVVQNRLAELTRHKNAILATVKSKKLTGLEGYTRLSKLFRPTDSPAMVDTLKRDFAIAANRVNGYWTNPKLWGRAGKKYVAKRQQ